MVKKCALVSLSTGQNALKFRSVLLVLYRANCHTLFDEWRNVHKTLTNIYEHVLSFRQHVDQHFTQYELIPTQLRMSFKYMKCFLEVFLKLLNIGDKNISNVRMLYSLVYICHHFKFWHVTNSMLAKMFQVDFRLVCY